MSILAQTQNNAPRSAGLTGEEKFVIFASTLGNLFEWYDFYLYGVLAPFLAALFFPAGNDTAALLSALATYAAGFLVRPFGAVFFGRIGDVVGRKYTFLVTIMVMGTSTLLVGFVPTYESIGWVAPLLLVTLRLLQGLAVGGEYGGAAVYVAEHARPGERGYATSWLQSSGTVALVLALIVIILCRESMDPKAFSQWGWRIPFIVSVILLVFSVFIRLRLNESPIFQRMKQEGKGSKAPLTESFMRYPNNKYVLLALFGVTAGMGVIGYTSEFYTLVFLITTLRVSYLPAYLLVLGSLIIGTPFFIYFGWLSDRIGRLKLIVAACLVAALTYLPLFKALTHYVNPDLEAFSELHPVTITADGSTCRLHVFVTAFTKFSACDRAQDFVTKLGLSFATESVANSGDLVKLTVGSTTVEGFDAAKWSAVFLDAGYPNLQRDKDGKIMPKPADLAKINLFMTLLILSMMVIYAAMVYGPVAAFLVELFPTRIRYTSLSLPYHIGAGVFGGMTPLLATAVAAATGNIYNGLWYPIGVSFMTAVIGGLLLHDTKDIDIEVGSGVEAAQRA
jgi:MFS family permease